MNQSIKFAIKKKFRLVKGKLERNDGKSLANSFDLKDYGLPDIFPNEYAYQILMGFPINLSCVYDNPDHPFWKDCDILFGRKLEKLEIWVDAPDGMVLEPDKAIQFVNKVGVPKKYAEQYLAGSRRIDIGFLFYKKNGALYRSGDPFWQRAPRDLRHSKVNGIAKVCFAEVSQM